MDQAASETVTVLLVDDDPLVHEVIRLALEDGGFDVLSAATGSEAIELLDARHVSIHALVTDINLGKDVDGWAVAKHARELEARLPVVYITGEGLKTLDAARDSFRMHEIDPDLASFESEFTQEVIAT